MNILTPRCKICYKASVVTVDRQTWMKYINGLPIQKAFPGLSPGDHELMVNGTHLHCRIEQK